MSGRDLYGYVHNAPTPYNIQIYYESYTYFKSTLLYYTRLKADNLERYLEKIEQDPKGALMDSTDIEFV